MFRTSQTYTVNNIPPNNNNTAPNTLHFSMSSCSIMYRYKFVRAKKKKMCLLQQQNYELFFDFFVTGLAFSFEMMMQIDKTVNPIDPKPIFHIHRLSHKQSTIICRKSSLQQKHKTTSPQTKLRLVTRAEHKKEETTRETVMQMEGYYNRS